MSQEEKELMSIRVWTPLDPDTIRKHLILIEDLYGMCANCKQIGLNYLKDKSCPGCNTQFRYVATKLKKSHEIAKILSRIKKENLQLTLIDRDDFDRASAKDALGDLFSV